MRVNYSIEQPLQYMGVSVVICTYNGAARLPDTLARLAKQEFTRPIRWEVIVIDNASTDNTPQIALKQRKELQHVDFRVVHEPLLGLNHARERGIEESKYEVISFVDDDNWVCSSWVQTVSEIMTAYPEVGACGGKSEAVFESSPPEWFDSFHGSFAVGAQGGVAGDITECRGWLWGAGLSVRKKGLDHLRLNGFQPLLTDRKGRELTSSGDMELCYALRLLGYKLWYDPSLVMQHYIPASRLNWGYLLGLYRGVGVASAGLDCYHSILTKRPISFREKVKYTWKYQVLTSLKMLCESALKRQMAPRGSLDYMRNDCSCQFFSARLKSLMKLRKKYDWQVEALRSANWLQQVG